MAKQTGVAEVGEHPPKLQAAQLTGGGVAVHTSSPRELVDGQEAVALDEKQPQNDSLGEDDAALPPIES